MREIIMGYQGEMSLKGLNRNQFESAMMKILRYRLKTWASSRCTAPSHLLYGARGRRRGHGSGL